jgi:hypothetical protein
MRFGVIVAVGILASACATTPEQKAAAEDNAGKVCKRMTVIGSIMPQNVCRTKEEWAAIDKQGREGVEDFDRARRELSPLGQ